MIQVSNLGDEEDYYFSSPQNLETLRLNIAELAAQDQSSQI